MQKAIFSVLSFIMLLSLAGAASAQGTVYVSSYKAKIMSGPSFKAKVLGEASRGTRIQSAGRKGRWVKVIFYKKEGYVSSLLLSKNPPRNRLSLIKGDSNDIKQSVRRRASTYTSAAAARGLTHEDRKRISAEEEVNYRAVEKMEAFVLTNDEVTMFMEGSSL